MKQGTFVALAAIIESDPPRTGADHARLAGVLRLQRAERQYLFELAECTDPEHERMQGDALPPVLADCVHSITAPAYILDRSWNVMSWNAPFLYLFDGWPERDAQPNLLRYIFLDSAALLATVDAI